MYPIVRKEKLADKIYLMDVMAPRVAKSCLPGQFIIVKMTKRESVSRSPSVIMTERRERLRSYSRLSDIPQRVWRNIKRAILLWIS